MTYPGGKAGSGVYQTIINQMPAHDVYIEGFLGGGAILKAKKPARLANIGIDIDAAVIAAAEVSLTGIPNLTLAQQDALGFLAEMIDNEGTAATLVYLDPPYLMETRRQQQRIYRYEMTDDDHYDLLLIITQLRCQVMISGYPSEMYDQALAGWRRITYQSMTRGGTPATEVLWMNYPEPFELHDYRYLGRNFRERERIKRKQARWKARLEKMNALERGALLQAIDAARSSTDLVTPEMAIIDEKRRDHGVFS